MTQMKTQCPKSQRSAGSLFLTIKKRHSIPFPLYSYFLNTCFSGFWMSQVFVYCLPPAFLAGSLLMNSSLTEEAGQVKGPGVQLVRFALVSLSNEKFHQADWNHGKPSLRVIYGVSLFTLLLFSVIGVGCIIIGNIDTVEDSTRLVIQELGFCS